MSHLEKGLLLLFGGLILSSLTTSCVGLKKYRGIEDKASYFKEGLAESKTENDQLKEKLDKLNAELTQVKNQNQNLENSNKSLSNALDSKKDELSKMVSSLNADKKELQEKIAELTKEKEELKAKKERQINEMQSTYNGLVSELQSEIKEGQIQITQLKGKLSVNVADKIFFDSGQSEIKESGKKVLQRVSDVLKEKLKDKQIRIEGHTDNVPIGGNLKKKFPTNWELSTDRATRVVRFLQEEGGIPGEILSAAGYGEHRPVSSNDTEENRKKNRRIEIVLLDRDVSRALTKSPKQEK